MKKTNYTINATMMPVKNMKQAAMLKKYGIDKPTEFEITQLGKFGLTDHLKGVVVTSAGIVLCNWELVMIAKAAKVESIEVTVIENLTEDEIPQVIAVKNLRKNLPKAAVANLIVDYRDYLTKTETGKLWAVEIPGDSTDAKIGTLVGYSYGMVVGYKAIHKHHPEYLEMIDAGELSYTTALKMVKDENETTDPETKGNPTTPVKPKAPKHNYAGEKNMVPCAPMESIQIRYADGRLINVLIDGNETIGRLFDKDIEPVYSSKKENFKEGAEFHRLDSRDNKFSIELVIRNAA